MGTRGGRRGGLVSHDETEFKRDWTLIPARLGVTDEPYPEEPSATDSGKDKLTSGQNGNCRGPSLGAKRCMMSSSKAAFLLERPAYSRLFLNHQMAMSSAYKEVTFWAVRWKRRRFVPCCRMPPPTTLFTVPKNPSTRW